MTTTIKQLPFQPMNDIHNEEIKVLETLLIAIKDKKDIEKNFALFLNGKNFQIPSENSPIFCLRVDLFDRVMLT